MNRMKQGVVLLVMLAAVALGSARAWAGCLNSVEAAVNWGNGKVYFFGYSYDNDYAQYVRYDIAKDKADAGYPKTVDESTWPGVDMHDIMAAVNWGNGKVYLFGTYFDEDGMYYVRYDIEADKVDPGYPALVTDENWPGLSMLPDISGALDIGDGNVYFFGYNFDYSDGLLGVTFNKEANRVLEDYPEEITPETTGGNELPSISAAVNFGDKFYLFGWSDMDEYHMYERFDSSTGEMNDGYPKMINAKTWPGLGCND